MVTGASGAGAGVAVATIEVPLEPRTMKGMAVKLGHKKQPITHAHIWNDRCEDVIFLRCLSLWLFLQNRFVQLDPKTVTYAAAEGQPAKGVIELNAVWIVYI